jgi:hypothetical protein
VAPNLHISYKHTDVKQYFKEQAGLRTEVTFNEVRDFLPIKALSTLRQLRTIGNQINARLLDAERLSLQPRAVTLRATAAADGAG